MAYSHTAYKYGYPLEFVLQWAVDSVIGVAGVTSGLHRDSVVLEVRGGNVLRIVDVEALPVWRHRMAGNAEASLDRKSVV